MDKTKTSVKSILVVIALFAVSVYTILFGTKQNPAIYTLSKIGFHFDNRLEFLIWGAVTGLMLIICTFYIFQKAGYRNRHAGVFLALSYAFLIMTVLVPNFKETMEFLFYVHVVCSALFVSCLLMSIILFIKHLCAKKWGISVVTILLFALSAAIPGSMLIINGATGIVEITFIVCISAFLSALNLSLTTEQKAGESKSLITA